MKQQEVFNRIGGIIKELNDQFKYLQDDPTKINELELELFVANAHFLANHAEVLKKLNVHEQPALPPTPPPTAEPPAPALPKEEKYFEPVVQKASVEDTPVPHIDLSSEAPEDDYSYIRQSEPEIIKHELEIDESWVDDEDEDEIVEISELELEPEPLPPVPQKPVDEKPIPPLVIEKPVSSPAKKEEPETLTINQRMSAHMPNKHESAAQSISDLKLAITLNDKLLFVKDLFNGYSLAYSEAIDILNKFSSFDEADKYLKGTYFSKNDWDGKPETREKFYALLHRRFA